MNATSDSRVRREVWMDRSVLCLFTNGMAINPVTTIDYHTLSVIYIYITASIK